MRIMDLAFIVLVFNGSLSVINEINPFGVGAAEFMNTTTTATELNATIPQIPGMVEGETEGSLSFLRRGLTGASSFVGALANSILLGSHIEQIMQTAFSLPIPDTLRTLLDAICMFIYAGAMYQIFLRFKTE